MLIEKKYQGTIPTNKILNEKTESNTDTYSCDYINSMPMDDLPLGSIIKYNGSEVPDGWKEVSETSDDSGWIYPTLNEGWSSTYSSAPTRYRKIGKIVHIESFVDATTEASNIIFTLPMDFRPSSQYYRYLAYAEGVTAFPIDIQSGNVYARGKSGAITWLSINHTFMVD